MDVDIVVVVFEADVKEIDIKSQKQKKERWLDFFRFTVAFAQ